MDITLQKKKKTTKSLNTVMVNKQGKPIKI